MAQKMHLYYFTTFLFQHYMDQDVVAIFFSSEKVITIFPQSFDGLMFGNSLNKTNGSYSSFFLMIYKKIISNI